ncbi:hypothetical protein QYF36_015496 [Acer negundo]|nr:hypothetical protein QYF36_015496 [Acer negundo]
MDVLENELVKKAYIKQKKASGRGVNAFAFFNGYVDTKGMPCELTRKAILEATSSTGKAIFEASGVNGKVMGSCIVKGGRSLDKGGANAIIREASGGRGVNAMASCNGSVDTRGMDYKASGSNGMVVIKDSGSNGLVMGSCGVNKDSCVGKCGLIVF